MAVALSKFVRLVPGGAAQPPEVAKRRLLTGLGLIVVATMLQTVPAAVRVQHLAPVAVRFGYGLVQMLLVAALLTRTYEWSHRRRASTFFTLVATIVVGLAASSVFVQGWGHLIETHPFLRGDGPLRTRGVSLAFSFVAGMLHIGTWALAFVFPYVAEDAKLRALEADKLRLEAEQLRVSAELARLRSQLEPHFLLNTLNAIAGFVTENPREARRLIACLGDLLRDSLEDGDELQPLEDEIAWLRRYAEILESRHAGMLSFAWEIDAGAKRTPVPRLLLQPLVENAVKHGALRRRGGGHVAVRATVSGGRVVCIVEDDGPGMKAEIRPGAFGLHSVRRRLEIKFPDAVLRMESSAEGTRAVVELPLSASVRPEAMTMSAAHPVEQT